MVTTSTPADRFDGNVKGLTRHVFLDSIIIALTTFIVGLPALNAVYNYFSYALRSFPVLRCYLPSSIGASMVADIEFLCLSHHTLYAVFYPLTATFFGATIAAVFYIWINNHSSKFDLFFSLVKNMEESDDLKENLTFVKKMKKVFFSSKTMHISYLIMKTLQALLALVAVIITIVLIHESPFDHPSLFQYDVTFYCQVNQFEHIMFNSSLLPDEQVPCTAINLRTTVAILYFNLFLLLLIFVCSIFSVLYPILNHRQFEHKEAARYSFHTGLSPYFYQSKFFRADLREIYPDSDYNFLMLFLLRTDAGLANKVWEALTFDEIELKCNDDLMRSVSNHRRYFVESATGTGPFQIPDDLGFTEESLKTALKTQERATKREDIKGLQLNIPRSFRGAVIGYCSAVAGVGSKVVYISFDPNSLGIPLALSFVIEHVYVVCFDPSRTVKDSEIGKCCYSKIGEHINFQQLIFPRDILVSKAESEIKKNFDKAGLFDIDCIVCGPVEDETAQNMKLLIILDTIEKDDKGCILLAITPNEGRIHKKEFFNITPDLIPKWSRLPVKLLEENSAEKGWKLPEIIKDPKTEPQKIPTGDGMFTFDLYKI